MHKIPVNIEDEMKQSFMDYAMSVIIARALPDVRDGMKPVHRRVLYTMYELGNEWNRSYKKSARVVGDVLGKYHPHGDTAVYDSVVRMAQDFSLRYPLVDGQGNFGSVDGDPAAAMRYTEVRMTRIAGELIADIDKETVDFAANYDETLREPVVLPSRLPNLLVNGSTGIAVGMTTNIPPHNLSEVVDATIALIERPAITVKELMEHIPGPDFPTAGFIHGRAAIQDAYETGKGVLQLRARATTEVDKKSGRASIIVSEIPFQVNKARLIERMAELVNEKRVDGISDLRDESDRDGMRIVIELKRDAVPEIVLNQLYKLTPMQDSFGIIMLAIVEGRPRLLTLKQVLQYFVGHRVDVVTRRTIFELRKAEERLHILDGLRIALDNLDGVIKLIRAAADPATARTGLMSGFGLSEPQAQAILDMRLQRLTNLERDKILKEHGEMVALIARLRQILADEREIYEIIVEELRELKKMFTTTGKVYWIKVHEVPQASRAARGKAIVNLLTLRPDEKISAFLSVREFQENRFVFFATKKGIVKKTDLMAYSNPRPSGIIAIGLDADDEVIGIRLTEGKQEIILSTRMGQSIRFKEEEVRSMGRGAGGVKGITLEADDEVVSIEILTEGASVLTVAENGYGKRTDTVEYRVQSRGGKGIITMKTTERTGLVVGVQQVTDDNNLMLVTSNGKIIRLRVGDIRVIGRNTQGVRLIDTEPGERVVSLARLAEREEDDDEPAPPDPATADPTPES